LGPYRVLRVLGTGGMGVVFEAEDPQLQRRVALKVIRPGQAGDVGRRRFLREARAAAAIEHDHIVPIYQVGEAAVSGTGVVPFLAMPFLRGETLEARLQREGKLPVDAVLRVGRELALGLAAAHQRGLIHRDIKPANIWLEAESQRVKILDFGLARSAEAGSSIPMEELPPEAPSASIRAAPVAQALTEVGSVLGTPAYMSPEQVSGLSIDVRSDLFSLGCVLYRAATGELPFKGVDVVSTLKLVSTAKPLPPRQLNSVLPARLSQLVMELLAKKPADRPASAHATAEVLASIKQGQIPPRRLWPGALLIVVSLLFALTGGALYWVVILPQGMGSKVAQDDNQETPWTPTTVNLLACIDPNKDVVRWRDLSKELVKGNWSIRDGELRSAASLSQNVIEIPYRPPEEYDLCVDFTRLGGRGDVSLALSKGGRSFQWCAAVEDKWFGFNIVGNVPIQQSPLRVGLDNAVRNGQRHGVVVQVREGGLKAFLDGQLINDLTTDGSNLSMFYAIRLRDDRLLGLSTWNAPAVFHRIEVVEISGPGTFTRPVLEGTSAR
jgi:serine/threonine protein kinase